ncbi:MAG: hypothetical protein MUE97_03210, partial [Phycisphaerales bacterium]|nr:hypothetical protein [Phycisphaerales bacterium]
RGKLLADGSVPQLLADHGGPSVVEVIRTGMTGTQRIESTDPVRTLATVAASDGGSSRVVSARIHGPTLESVFLHLTGRSLRD